VRAGDGLHSLGAGAWLRGSYPREARPPEHQATLASIPERLAPQRLAQRVAQQRLGPAGPRGRPWGEAGCGRGRQRSPAAVWPPARRPPAHQGKSSTASLSSSAQLSASRASQKADKIRPSVVSSMR
jgi:hypothetical protein